MEREISSGAMVGIVLLALASTIGIGFGVFALAGGYKATGHVINPINSTVLAVTFMIAWVTFLLALRLSYLTVAYYDKRFKFTLRKGGNLQVQYLKNRQLNIFQILLFLFKPVRFKQIDEFTMSSNKELHLKGVLQVTDKTLFIDNYYIEANTDLFEYIGEKINLVVVGNQRQVIEKNISDYIVKSVDVVKA